MYQYLFEKLYELSIFIVSELLEWLVLPSTIIKKPLITPALNILNGRCKFRTSYRIRTKSGLGRVTKWDSTSGSEEAWFESQWYETPSDKNALHESRPVMSFLKIWEVKVCTPRYFLKGKQVESCLSFQMEFQQTIS